ncbi:MAG: hypothetical protein GY798_34880 [Hyphomicrobiales bacterium]|nr:hypothetical protein [Hyphomicrobiales bacterium]
MLSLRPLGITVALFLVALLAFRPASFPLIILFAAVCIGLAVRWLSVRRARKRWARLQGWAKHRRSHSVDAATYPGCEASGPLKAFSRH